MGILDHNRSERILHRHKLLWDTVTTQPSPSISWNPSRRKYDDIHFGWADTTGRVHPHHHLLVQEKRNLSIGSSFTRDHPDSSKNGFHSSFAAVPKRNVPALNREPVRNTTSPRLETDGWCVCAPRDPHTRSETKSSCMIRPQYLLSRSAMSLAR